MHLPRRAAFALLALAAACSSALAAGPGSKSLWLHVAVDEQDKAGSQVRVTLPLGLIEGLLPFLNDHARGHLRVSDVDGVDLRRAWEVARSAPEGRFVEIPTQGDGTLHVAHQDGQLVFRARDDDSEARVRMPWKVAEQLAAASGDVDFDLRTMVRALRDFGPGELVTAEDRNSTVRLWIDEENSDD